MPRNKAFVSDTDELQAPMRPALSPEAKEQQMVHLATDLAEKRIRAGTASDQLLVHYLKLGTTVAKLDKEKSEIEKKLLQAKIAALESQANSAKLYSDALKAFRSYSADSQPDEEDNIDETQNLF